ncbi:colorectal mutant cancer protein [Daktulosphaira vitifoliae]|uniref:colorectal mutant cancer protein n=1 Tax=Daktulosphaira vitifoliae TaxID=58002 RepID=UPI0021AB08FC|nr:colorectal mutant cancer protein [Daktulosphaira vitifoliae]
MDEQQSVCESAETSSLCEEERARKLFQACDGDGDGFIDSRDLLTICRQLNLEDSVDKLMKELGADKTGRISFDEFVRRRLELRTEINALRVHNHDPLPEYLPTSSDNSLGALSGGKHESWEFDSGARDLSPEPNSIRMQHLLQSGSSANTGSLLHLANKLHLAALKSLKTEITELNKQLTLATEKNEALEESINLIKVETENEIKQKYEERIIELHSVIAELARKLQLQRSQIITEEIEESQSELDVQSVETFSLIQESVSLSKEGDDIQCFNDDETKNNKYMDIYTKLAMKDEELKLTQKKLQEVTEEKELLLKFQDADSSYSPGPMSPSRLLKETSKLAEKVKLQKLMDDTAEIEKTKVVILQKIELDECKPTISSDFVILEPNNTEILMCQVEQLQARLDYVRSQMAVLELMFEQSATQTDKLYLLLGKYESNMIALKLEVNIGEEIMNCYSTLLSISDGTATEEEIKMKDTIIEQLHHLDEEKKKIGSTVVVLESYHSNENDLPKLKSRSQITPIDLEMAVLVQELMSVREEKFDLQERYLELQKQYVNVKKHLSDSEEKSKIDFNTIRELERQLKEDNFECVEGINIKLKNQLKEVTSALQQMTKTSDARQKQNTSLIEKLKTENSLLERNLERSKRKSHLRLKKLESEIEIMVENHSLQVNMLKERISVLEKTLVNSGNQNKITERSETTL